MAFPLLSCTLLFLRVLCACALSAATQTTTVITSSATEHVTVLQPQFSTYDLPGLVTSSLDPSSSPANEGTAETAAGVSSDMQTRCEPQSTGENSMRLEKALVACLLPFDQSRLFAVQRVRPAIDVALEKIASLGLLPRLELQVRYRDSKCSISDAMNEAVNFYANNTAHVYLGPTCDYAAAPVARQVRYWNKAMVSAGAMAGEFGLNKLDMFPLLTRVGANFNSLVACLLSLLKQFHWNRLKLLYDPDGYTEVMDRYCHIAVNALHYGLRVARTEGHSDLRHDHSKFYSVQLALQDLPLEVGNEYAG